MLKRFSKEEIMAGKAKVTIKDVAKEAGVSQSSVHLALSGKAGVSESTRQRILEIARRMNYTPSPLAANLKRETLTIAVVLPEKNTNSRFYYDFMRDAAVDYGPVAQGYNLNLLLLEFSDLAKTLAQLDLGAISGLITMGYPEDGCTEAISQVSKAGVPVILLDNDLPESGRICCIKSNNDLLGKLTGELLMDMIRWPSGEVLVCAGFKGYPNHYEIVDGLAAFLKEQKVQMPLVREYFHDIGEEPLTKLKQQLLERPIVGCCTVNSRATLVMAQALDELGMAKRIPLIGSGLYSESVRYLERGVVMALINKRPYEQCYQALQMMTDLLVRSEAPEQPELHVGGEVVFRSMLEQYERISFRKMERMAPLSLFR